MPIPIQNIYSNFVDLLSGDIESLTLEYISQHLTKVTKTKAFGDLSKEVMFTIVQEAASRLNLD